MITKVCTKCGEDKELGEYYKSTRGRHGRKSRCRACNAKYRAANKGKIADRHAKWYAANKDRVAASQAKWSSANKDKVAAKSARYRAAHKDKVAAYCAKYHAANKDRIAELGAKWYAANKDKVAAKARLRRKTNPALALTDRTRSAVRRTLKNTTAGSTSHLPYTHQQLYDHLLTTLPEGYTEADICDGRKLHIDHIRPVSSFNLTGEIDDEFHACWALSNLQLLPAAENIRKGASLDHLERAS